MRLCKQDIAAFRPDVVILIDYPGFNPENSQICETSFGYSGLLLYFS